VVVFSCLFVSFFYCFLFLVVGHTLSLLIFFT
jgi:hypothetical protein